MEFHIVVLLALVASALAGPIAYRDLDGKTCARECTQSSKFRYTPGTTYVYDYLVKTVTTLEHAGASSALLLLNARADVEVLSKCDMALTLRDARLQEYGPDGRLRDVANQGALRRLLEGRPLRFGFQDGVVSELCPAPGEDPWAMNVKRGVLSALQNGMNDITKAETLQEDDVTGRCPVQYTPAGSGWYDKSIKKSKDLLGCTDRNGLRSVLQATPYRVPSEVQSLPLLKSTHECTQDIDSSLRYVKRTVCSERHVFRPFSRHDSGATTSVEQSLTFQSTRPGVQTAQDTVGTRASLHYEHAYAPGQENQGRRDAVSKLEELCRSTKDDIRPETPRLFAQLVQVLKALDVSSLREVLSQAQSSSLCGGNVDRTKKFFLDALPMTQTSAGVQLMTELLLREEVSGLDAEVYVTSLALLQHPSSEMLQHTKALVESDKLSGKSLLAVSSLVNNYCQTQKGCGSEPAVVAIMDSLEKIIGTSCYVSDKHLNKILLALRAAGNAGHATFIVPLLKRCLRRRSNPLEVRVAALQAFRRQPCSADRSEVVRTFQDERADHELRITAYLAAMACPSQELLQTVKQVLENEDVSQLTSFVWTHLGNLLETSSPHKQALRGVVEDAKLRETYSPASLKYSRNMEASFFLEKLNLGAVAESNVVWSQDSYPRSAMLNLTTDLFGSSINLLEVGGRLEGLDMLLESYLGPYGYFGDKNSKNAKKRLDDVRGSVYLRLFGNELAFGHFKGMEAATSGSQFNMLDFLIDLSKDHDYKFSQSQVFLDTTLTVPTAGGLPLHLTVNGTASVDMVASGKLDLRKVATSPRSLTVDGVLQPSGAVEIVSTMSVDGGVTSGGLRMVSTLHSSTSLRGRVELQRGKVLKMEWDVPQDKMELFDVKSTFFTLHGGEEKEQDLITDNRKSLKLCSGDKLAKVTGFELCGEVSFPNASMKNEAPYFPFTGPVSASLSLFKRDSHSSYKLIAKRNENAYSSMAQLAFDTPGSAVDRALSFDTSLNYKKKEFELSLLSPWKRAFLTSSLTNERKQRGIAGKLTVDDKREYSFKAQLNATSGGKDDVWRPLVEVKSPSTTPVALTGSILARRGQRVEMDLTLAGVTAKPLNLKSTVINANTEKSVDALFNAGNGDYSMLASVDLGANRGPRKTAARLNVKTPRREIVNFAAKADYRAGKSFKGDAKLSAEDLLKKPLSMAANVRKMDRGKGPKFQGQVTLTSQFASGKTYGFVQVRNKGGVQSRLTVDYAVPRVSRDKITLSGKFNDKSTKSLTKFIANANLALKRNPQYNLVTGVDFSHNKRHTEAGAWLVHGKDTKSKTNRFDVNASLRRKGPVTLKAANLNFRGSLSYPPQDVNVLVKGSHEHSKSKVDSGFSLKYGKDKEANMALLLKDASSKLTKVTGSFKSSLPGHKMSVGSSLTQRNQRLYEHTLTVGWNKDSHAVKTTYRNTKGTHSVDCDVQVEGVRPVRFSASSNLEPLAHKGDLSMAYKSDKYEVKTSHKLASGAGKLDLEVAYPERRLLLALDGGKTGRKYSASMDADWDADNKKSSSRVKLDGNLRLGSFEDVSANGALSYPSRDLTFNLKHQKKGNTFTSHTDFAWGKRKEVALDVTLQRQKNKLSGDVALTTPFNDFEKMAAGVVLSEDADRYTAEAMGSLGNKKLRSVQTLLRPVSLQNLALTWEASTPFYGWRSLGASLTHSLDSGLNTQLKGNVGKKTAELTLVANNRGDLWIRRDVDATATFKSSIKNWEEVVVSARHQDDGNRLGCEYRFTRNGLPHSLKVDLSAYRQGWQVESNGQILVIVPRDRMNVNWQHRNTGNQMVTDVTANLGSGRIIRYSMTGNHQLAATRKMSGSVTLQSPWKVAEDLALTFDHEHGIGFIRSVADLKKQGSELASSQVNYQRRPGRADFDFTVATPFGEDVSGKINSRYAEFPVKGHAELTWSRDQKLALDGNVDWGLPFGSTVRLVTPWEPVRSVLVAASHKEEEGQWLSMARLDVGYKKMAEAKSTLGLGDHKMASLQVTLPFQQLQLVEAGGELVGDLSSFLVKTSLIAEPALGRYSSEATWRQAADKLDGKVRVETPVNGFKYGQVVLSAQGSPLTGSGSLEIDYDSHQVITLTTSHDLDKDADMEVTLLTPYAGFEYLNAKMTNDLTNSRLNSHAEFSYDRYNKVEADLLGAWDRDYMGSLTVRTPFPGYEENVASFRHTGSLQNFDSHAEGRAMGHHMKADAGFQYGYTSKATASFESSLPNWERVVFGGESTGPLDNWRSSVSLEYGQNQRAEAQMQLNFNRAHRVKAVLSAKSPYTQDLDFNFDMKASSYGYTHELSYSYGSDYIFTDKATVRLTDAILVKRYITCICPAGVHTHSFLLTHEGTLREMDTALTVGLNDQEYKVTSSFHMTPVVKGALTVQTPYEDFKNTGVDFEFQGSQEAFDVKSTAHFLDDKSVEAKASFSHKGLQQINGQLEVATPFQGYRRSRVVVSQNGAWDDFKSHLEAQVGRSELNADANFQHGARRTGGSLIITSTLDALQNMKMLFSKEGSNDNFRSSGSLTLNGVELVSSVIGHKKTGFLLASSLQVTNHYTEPLNLAIDVDATISQQTAKLSASLGRDYSVESESSLSIALPAVTGSTKLTYKVAGDAVVEFLTFKKEGEWNNMRMTLTGASGGKSSDVVLVFKNTDKVMGSLSVATPMVNYRDVGLSFEHSGPADNFNSAAQLRYKDGEELALTGRFYRNQWRRVDANLQLTTPFRGLELTKVEYTHTGDSRGFTCQGKADYSQGKAISGDLRLTTKPKVDFDFKVKTPFEGFEDMSASATYDGQRKRYNADGKLAIGSDAVSLAGSLDYASSPMTASLTLTTPLRNFDLSQLKLTHEGELLNFKTSADFQTPMTDSMSGEMVFRYGSLTDMEVSTTLTSKIPSLENLKLATKAFESGPVYNHHIEVGWTPQDEIALDTTFRQDKQWYESNTVATATLTTPFPQLRSAQVTGKHLTGSDKVQQEFGASLNGETLLDADWSYGKTDKHAVSMNMRQPRAMQVEATGSSGDSLNGEVLVNWDRNHPESNVRVKVDYDNKDSSSQTQRDFSLKVVHPVRTMGVEGSLTSSPAMLKSTGALILHERDGDKVWYELETDESGSYYGSVKQGSLKLGLPTRTLQARGSSSSRGQVRSLEGALLWDAERSEDKQVGAKLVLTPASTSSKADLSLRLPSISKEFEIGSEVTVNEGRTLFDSKTEFSYSRDARKTLVLTSRLEDISHGYGSTNYSLSLGVSHPQTDVNVQLKSHAGVDEEKVTGALDLQYLTSARQTKTLFLLGEIDKLRRQISVMMDSPVQQLQATGRVETLQPLKVTLKGLQGGVPFHASAEVDTDEKTASLRSTYDLDNPDHELVLYASYLNATYIQATASRKLQGSSAVRDAEMSLALATPRILSSKITWRPSMLQNVEDFLSKKVTSNGASLLETIDSVSAATRRELRGKYRDVARALKTELTQLASLLDQEMADVSRELQDAQRSLRRMYGRNAFFLKDMGESVEQAYRFTYDSLRQLVDAYGNFHEQVSSSMSQFLDGLTKLPVASMYDDAVRQMNGWLKEKVLEAVRQLQAQVAMLDESLTAMRSRYTALHQTVTDTINENVETLKMHPVVQRMRNSLPDYEAYVDAAHRQLQSLSLPQQYTSAIYGARDLISSGLSQIVDAKDMQNVRDASNEVYQQAVWAYQYWEVEENMKEHIKSILRALEEIVKDEMAACGKKLDFLKEWRVETWRPQDGLLAVRMGLPLPLQDLQSPPDVGAAMQEVEAMAARYLPSKKTVMDAYDTYFPKSWFVSNKTTPIPEDDMDAQLQEYLNSPENRRRNRPVVRGS